jgi:transcriptional regulator with XRE-family HTH domain
MKRHFMPKAQRALSPYATDALVLLGQLIRKARIDRHMKAIEVAERAGISRGLLRRIESGDPGAGIGTVFEVAAIVGVRLFDADKATLAITANANNQIMTLLPKSVRSSRRREARDDF